MSEEEFLTRQNNFDMQKKLRIEEKIEATKDNDLEGCTFRPQMETVHEGEKRNLNQFLLDQSKFLDQKDAKIKGQLEQQT